MTDAKFCDLHGDKLSSLIRVQSGQRSFYTLRLGYDLVEKGKDGKKIRWTVESKPIHVCAKDILELVIQRAKALDVEIEWNEAYRLVRGDDGKYKRIVKSGELEEPIEA